MIVSGLFTVTSVGAMSISVDALENEDEINQVLISFGGLILIHEEGTHVLLSLAGAMPIFVTALACEDGGHAIVDKFPSVTLLGFLISLVDYYGIDGGVFTIIGVDDFLDLFSMWLYPKPWCFGLSIGKMGSMMP